MHVRLQGRIPSQPFRSQYCIQYQWLQRFRSITFEVAQLLIWKTSFASVYIHRQFNQLPQCHLRVLLLLKHHHLNLAPHLTTHNAIAGILSQMILWSFIISNFCSPATFTKSHSMYFRKESKTAVIFSPANQILSQNQKYKLSIIITGFLILKMTKYKTLLFFSLLKSGHKLMQSKLILCTAY